MDQVKIALVATTMLGAGDAAFAESYRASTGFMEREANTAAMMQFAVDLSDATGGELDFQVFPGGVLMPNKSHLGGIADGVAQMGLHISGYTPSDLPISNSLAGFGFIDPDPITISFAFADFAMHDEELHEEFRSHGVVPIAGFAGATYSLVCNTNEPVTEAEQIIGLKVRSFGLIGELISDLGGIPVSIPISEAYQALQMGQIDCVAIFANYLNVDDKLDEVSKFTTLTGWSPAFTSPMHLYNEGFWQGLTDEQRKIVFELSAQNQARIQVDFHEKELQALDAAKSKGHLVSEPGETLTRAVDAWIEDGVGDMAKVAKEVYGIQNPEEVFARFNEYIVKWQELVGGMSDKYDEEELTQLLLQNIYADLDPAQYGMK